jgi:hypothetical protein
MHAGAPTGARRCWWTGGPIPPTPSPVFAALMAGEWLMGRGEGDVDSEDETRDLLTATGWMMIGRLPLTGPASLGVAERR